MARAIDRIDRKKPSSSEGGFFVRAAGRNVALVHFSSDHVAMPPFPHTDALLTLPFRLPGSTRAW
jgi:hypothetical protein